MKFDIKNRWTDRVHFTAEIKCSEDESYSIKLGLAARAAVKAGADLVGADLVGAELAYVNLAGVNLDRANLDRANLDYTNLAEASLVDVSLAYVSLAYANLADTNLTGADLGYANFVGAELVGTNLTDVSFMCANFTDASVVDAKWGNDITLARAPIQICNIANGWPITILDRHMQIGCELHTHEDWVAFDDRRILEMDGKQALVFWRANKDWLIAACASHAAVCGKVKIASRRV